MSPNTLGDSDEAIEERRLRVRRTSRRWLIVGPLLGLLAGLLLVNAGFTTEVIPLRDGQGDLLVVRLYGLDVAAERGGVVSFSEGSSIISHDLTYAARRNWRFRASLVAALFGLAVGLSVALTRGLRAEVVALREELLWARVRIARLEAPDGRNRQTAPRTPDDPADPRETEPGAAADRPRD
jgi:hypothetical protein